VIGIDRRAVYVACGCRRRPFGTLLPIVRDAGELQSASAAPVAAVIAIGEFGRSCS